MANNRLYIGNASTKQYLLYAKGWGNGWKVKTDQGRADHFVDCCELESESGKTSLIFLTEGELNIDEKFKDWSEVTEFDQVTVT